MLLKIYDEFLCEGLSKTLILLVVVDVRDAGEGTLEIGISGPSGQNIPNNVLSLGPSQFEVTFVPCESGQHRANITFNRENVNGRATARRFLF